VTRWLLIDTIAMIGSPTSRGAVASTGSAGFFAAKALEIMADDVRAASAAIAASVTATGGFRRCIATVDRALVDRCPMPQFPVRACVALVAIMPPIRHRWRTLHI
jgi:hypothetical protein